MMLTLVRMVLFILVWLSAEWMLGLYPVIAERSGELVATLTFAVLAALFGFAIESVYAWHPRWFLATVFAVAAVIRYAAGRSRRVADCGGSERCIRDVLCHTGLNGFQVRCAREAKGLSWYAVAKAAGIPNQNTVRDIEYGRDVNLSNLEAVAAVLGLRVELVAV